MLPRWQRRVLGCPISISALGAERLLTQASKIFLDPGSLASLFLDGFDGPLERGFIHVADSDDFRPRVAREHLRVIGPTPVRSDHRDPDTLARRGPSLRTRHDDHPRRGSQKLPPVDACHD